MTVTDRPVTRPTFRDRARTQVEPFARLLGRVGLTPNALTLIGFGIAVVAAWMATRQAWLAAGLLVAFGAIFDLFDGALARATNRTSRLGAFMDSTFDRAGEAVVYIGIAVGAVIFGGFYFAAVAAMAAMAASFMVSYTRAKAESLGFSSGTGLANVGVGPREVRMVILVIGLVIAGSGPLLVPSASLPGTEDRTTAGTVMLLTLGLIAVLATITTIQRILFVFRESKSQEVND